MRELFGVLMQSEVPMLIIGGHGLALHKVQRLTLDLDCMVAAVRRVELTAYLQRRGFEEMGRHQGFSRFRHRSLVYPILDVMAVDAGTWAKMEPSSISGELFGYAVRVPSVAHYVAMKLHATKNPERESKDLLDIISLVRANRDKVSDAELEEYCQRYAAPGYWAKLRASL